MPKSWLAIGGAGLVVLILAGFFLLKPSGEDKVDTAASTAPVTAASTESSPPPEAAADRKSTKPPQESDAAADDGTAKAPESAPDSQGAGTGIDKASEAAPASKVLKTPEEVLADPDFKACKARGGSQIADCDRAIASGKFEGPALATVYNNRGQARGEARDDDGALEDFNKAIELGTNFGVPYTNRGMIYSDRKEYDRAIAEFDKAIELDATHPIPFESRGRTYWLLGDVKRAAADYEKALSLNPPPELKERLEKDLRQIKIGVKLVPASEPAQKQGAADTPTDDKNSALSAASEGSAGDASGLPSTAEPEGGQGSQGSAKAQPPTSGPWAAIAADGKGLWGYSLSQPSQDAAANAALEDCGDDCKIIGDRALEASCIAYVESRQGGYWYFGYLGANESAVQDNAMNACNKAAPAGSCKLVKSLCAQSSAAQASADPKKDADYFRNRGNTYISTGDYDKALADFDQAIKLAPESFGSYQGRALAYFKKGITGLARDDYNKALSLNPDADSRKEIEKALKDLGPDIRNMKAQ
jgi:tetratricopeptide (TPR) repeat protein